MFVERRQRTPVAILLYDILIFPFSVETCSAHSMTKSVFEARVDRWFTETYRFVIERLSACRGG